MGKVILSGIVPLLEYTAPIKGILASDLAIGSSVHLMENGVATEYLVVNQGIPSNSFLYDASCDGTWLLRKDCSDQMYVKTTPGWYENTLAHSYLNDTFFHSFGSIEQSTIREVKIPYHSGTGASGLTTKVFLLSAYEIGVTNANITSLYEDGVKLDYFESGGSTSACGKRIAKFNGSDVGWWVRSEGNSNYQHAAVDPAGDCYMLNNPMTGTWGSYCYRPAIVLPSNARFDPDTLILKGVA